MSNGLRLAGNGGSQVLRASVLDQQLDRKVGLTVIIMIVILRGMMVRMIGVMMMMRGIMIMIVMIRVGMRVINQ